MRHKMRALRLGVSLGPVLLLCAGLNSVYAQATAPQLLANQPPRTYDVKTMNFDLWCQETQQYPADRCDKRLPTDVMAFETYRDAVERYELQYLQQGEQNRAAESRNNIDPTQTERTRQDTPVQ